MAALIPLAADFPSVTEDDWRAAVEATLRGRPVESLEARLPDGITLRPLYHRADERPEAAAPGQRPWVRGARAEGRTAGWDLRSRHRLDGPMVGDAVLEDLERGVTSIELLAPASPAVTPAELDAQLRRALRHVILDLAPVGLAAPGDGVLLAERLLAYYNEHGATGALGRVDLGCDPIGWLARRGHAGRPIAAALGSVAALAAGLEGQHQGLRVMRADGSPYADAGATPAEELAATLSTAVAYLRVLTEAGLGLDEALGRIAVVLTVDADQFTGIAKLRAARLLWDRMAAACAATTAPVVQAVTAAAMYTRYDPWVNLLRATLATFAAGVGGADAITVLPFDTACGEPDELGRRLARNTALILQDEANLHRVIDPAGGSWYLESYTDALARSAWTIFQEIESGGGIVAVLGDGSMQSRLATSWGERAMAIARRREPIVGVSEFPLLGAAVLARGPAPSFPPDPTPAEVEPLPLRRRAEAFELLRDRAARAAEAGSEPAIFLANLGAGSDFTARAAFASNLFAAGGIRSIDTGGYASPEEAAAAFAASGVTSAVICSSDAVYAEQAADTARALRTAGAERTYLAGAPGEVRERYEAAGILGFVHVGCDVVAVLTAELDAALGPPVTPVVPVAGVGQ